MKPRAWIVHTAETGDSLEFAQRARANGYAMLQRARGYSVRIEARGFQ
jgi:hypothetical protein